MKILWTDKKLNKIKNIINVYMEKVFLDEMETPEDDVKFSDNILCVVSPDFKKRKQKSDNLMKKINQYRNEKIK